MSAPDKLNTLGDAPQAPQVARRGRDRSIPFPVIIFVFVLFALFGGGRRGTRDAGVSDLATGLALGALSGRGGWGGGGRSSGGSWGGGGGGFSGGGASGGW